MPDKIEVIKRFQKLQSYICDSLEQADKKSTFSKESWVHHSGGGGLTRIIENGQYIQKGGVNFSSVEGILPEKIAHALGLPLNSVYLATGVSIVMHPQNPFAPIMHMNVRYFELANGTYWFGGGIDMTPHYVDLQDAKYFHKEVKRVCDDFHKDAYDAQKKNADDYFFNIHRDETRGVGGTFFDRMTDNNLYTKTQILNYCCSILDLFPKIYTYFIHKNNQPFTEKERIWQDIRRGRYVEFNLVYDKGTKFGLDTNGRVESILMSLPKTAQWHYNFTPLENSQEAFTQQYLKKNIDWLSF